MRWFQISENRGNKFSFVSIDPHGSKSDGWRDQKGERSEGKRSEM